MSNRRSSNSRRAPSLYLISSMILIVGLGVSFGGVTAYNAFEIRAHTKHASLSELEAAAGRFAARVSAVFASVRNIVDVSSGLPDIEVAPSAESHPATAVMARFLETNPFARSVSVVLDNAGFLSVGRVANAAVPDNWSVPADAVFLAERLWNRPSDADGAWVSEIRFLDGRSSTLAAEESQSYESSPVDGLSREVSAASAGLVASARLPGVLEEGPAFVRRFEQGVVIAGIDTRRLEETADTVAENRSVLVVDSHGRELISMGSAPEVARVVSDRLVSGQSVGESSTGAGSGTSLNGQQYIAGARRIPSIEDGRDVAHVILVEEWPPFYEDRSLIVAVAVGIGVAAAMIVLGLLLIGRLSRVLSDLSRMAGSIGRLVLDGTPRYSPRARELSELNAHMDSMRSALGAVTRYLPRTLVQQFIEKSLEPELGGTWRDISVMFTGIRGFTSFAEQENSGIVFLQLSEYFRIVGRAIREHEGMIDKYIGDAIMALWNASTDIEKHSRKSVITALSIRHLMFTINELWEENGQPRFESRIGIHTGSALVGNIGSDERLDFTAMGSTVNLAARLEPMNKYFDTDILVSKDVLESAGPGFVSRQIGIVRPRGSDQNVEIFEVVGAGWEAPECPAMVGPEEQQKASAWSAILKLFYDREWKKTISFIDDFLAEYPGDRIAIVYRDLATKYARKEPGKGWHGVLSLR